MTSLAVNALNKVEVLAEKLGAAESMLESGYAELAEAILAVQAGRFWEGAHASWKDYMNFVINKHHMGRAQLYSKVRVVKELQGLVEPKDLSRMGISKAAILADTYTKYEKLPGEVIAAAKDENTTVKQLKQAVATALHAPEAVTDEWYDMGFAFYVNPEEKQELMQAEKIARGIDPPISTTLKDFMQKKEVALRFAREFLSTYSTDAETESSF